MTTGLLHRGYMDNNMLCATKTFQLTGGVAVGVDRLLPLQPSAALRRLHMPACLPACLHVGRPRGGEKISIFYDVNPPSMNDDVETRCVDDGGDVFVSSPSHRDVL
jgi:hypothetical protein